MIRSNLSKKKCRAINRYVPLKFGAFIRRATGRGWPEVGGKSRSPTLPTNANPPARMGDANGDTLVVEAIDDAPAAAATAVKRPRSPKVTPMPSNSCFL